MDNNERINLFNGFTLDLARGCVVREGEPVHLRPQTYEVLKYLVENRSHLVSKDKLIEEVWKGRAVTEGSLSKCIEEVRDALGPEAKEYVRNVRGRGYIFDTGIEEPKAAEAISVRSEQIDVVRVLIHEEEIEEEIDGEPISPPKVPAISTPRSAIRSKTATLGVALFVGIAAIAFGIYWLIGQRRPGDARAVAVPFHGIDISRLTTSGKTRHAVISPDGKYVAHTTEDAEGASLWVRNVAAPSIVRLAGPAVTEYMSVTFSPDGESVYYLTLDRDKGETALYRVSVLGGPSRRAAYDVGPVGFSPDGKQMGFVRIYHGESRLIVANADGTNEQTLATHRPPDFFRNELNAPAWSPDGKTIACPIRLNDDRGHYETVISVSVEDRAESPLTSARWNYVGQSVWLPDGSGLVVTARESAIAPEQIWHIPLKSGEATRITHDLDDYHDLSLTRDSSTIAAVQDYSVSSIWVAGGGDAAHARQVSSEVGWLDVLAWTSDGRIVYRSNAGGSGADIWIMDADGSNPKQVSVGARASRGLAATPDGRYIIFVSDRSEHFNIWRMDSDGGNLRQLTGGDGEFYPHCTPDGQWVVYQHGETYPTLWKVPTEGGEPVQVTESRAGRPAVSPDGEMIAYSYLDTDLPKLAWGIGIVSAKGGQRLKRFDFPPTVTQRFVHWSPDGLTIAYSNRPGGLSDIWSQPLDGSPPRRLTDFKAEQIIAFDWSRDGRSLAFVRGVQTSDVVLIVQREK